ncbi:outer membrane protein assembly factor BamB family protein [Nonomuraea sp. KM88]|uniref:outer membrane protein assembly factor BamB family protein n=1 Tax=Nonomuraea sp. KM88 TaxID=3457427 RepID=UPI003FCCB60F
MSSWRIYAAAGLLLLTTGCSLLGEDAEDVPDVRRERTFATAGPRQLTGAGPAPGVMREAWRVKGLGQGDDRQIRLEGGQLFVAGADGFDVYDAGTGRKRWHYREPGRELTGFAVTKDDLVVASRSEEGSHLTGLAAGTGRLRWERGDDEGKPFTGGPGRRLAVGEGVVPLLVRAEPSGRDEEEKPDEFLALDAATGEERWRRPHHAPNGCDVGTRSAATDTDGSVLVFRESCRDDHYLYAFNPSDGKPLWSRTGTSDDSLVGISVRAGATLIELDEHTRTLVGRDDREIANLNGIGRCLAPCSLRSVGDDLGLMHLDESRDVTLSVIDVAGGQLRTLTTPHDTMSVTAGGRLYGVSAKLGGTLLPARLTVLDAATEQVTTMPLPLSLDSDVGGLRWLGTAGGHLLVATSKGDDLVAYASTPTDGPLELGGVAKDEWPQACDLLKDVPGRTTARTPMVEGPVRIGSQELARSRCHVNYSAHGKDGQAIAEVLWVAATAAEADGLVNGETGLHGADEVQKSSDEVVLVRKGRFVVKVQSRQEDDLQRIVAGVVSGLG